MATDRPRPLGDRFRPTRRATRVVQVGDVAIGGDNPIRIQSMTNTDTMDTDGTVEQTVRLAEAGCEIVRLTAPSIRDAENLEVIKARLAEQGVDVPIVADIHFTPNAAMIAANWVEKVRVNPGNYADKKKFEVREYDDREYEAEIERVAERFRPLVQRCKENGVAMRIGTNHGSLSDRILNRYGDTPQGMVESALEFLDVCESENYHDVIFSMKASNTQVAIQAYRFLAARLEERAPGEPSYPFHVGVTEAGDAEDGRIKSAIGIGALLEDGIGDTIRVSLTEDPVREVPVARQIAERAERVRAARAVLPPEIGPTSKDLDDSFAFERRPSAKTHWGEQALGGDALVRVEAELPGTLARPVEAAAELSLELAGLRDVELESILLEASNAAEWEALPIFVRELASLGHAIPVSVRIDLASAAKVGELPISGDAFEPARVVARVATGTSDASLEALAEQREAASGGLEWELDVSAEALPALVQRVVAAAPDSSPAFSLTPSATVHDHRLLVAALRDSGAGAEAPIVLRHDLASSAEERAEASTGPAAAAAGAHPLVVLGETRPAPAFSEALSEASLIDASVRLGALLCDGIGDAVSMRVAGSAGAAIDSAYRVLQGARQRTTRTEYISCPSCGRTLFDLEETTARIKERTDHLRGVKIAVMGCIVNGPGEMADADFGYVGSGVGQVTLYVGQEVVARAVPEAEATDRLVSLIQEHGQWIEPGGAASGAAGTA